MYINDVGESTWEEIDEGFTAGLNFGWPITEGPTTDPRFASPRFAYRHGSSDTTGCAITGGVFYNPPFTQFPGDSVGDYFFADLCSGWIRQLDVATGAVTSLVPFGGIDGPVDLATSPDGALYYLAHGGSLGRISAVTQHWFLRNSNSPGTPDLAYLAGFSGGTSMTCDWDGNGTSTQGSSSTAPGTCGTTIGGCADRDVRVRLDRRRAGVWRLGRRRCRHDRCLRKRPLLPSQQQQPGAPSVDARYGSPGDRALVGDWDGNGVDTIGVQEFGHLYMRNANSPGAPDFDVAFGTPNDTPVAGDWDGNGTDTIGVYEFHHFYLRNANAPGAPDIDVFYGGPIDRPVTGDFDGNGTDTIGVVE